MRGGRAAGVGSRAKRGLTPELLEGRRCQLKGKLISRRPLVKALVCTNHSSSPRHRHTQQPVTENDCKANLQPVRTVSSALHSPGKAHLYPHNEVAERRAARGGGNGGAKWRKLGEKKMRKSQGDKRVKQTTPVEGTFIFPQETHKHATRSSQFNKDRQIKKPFIV